eukprot:scaffold2256_cov166-Amphora_coffeaeformis.AAC.18
MAHARAQPKTALESCFNSCDRNQYLRRFLKKHQRYQDQASPCVHKPRVPPKIDETEVVFQDRKGEKGEELPHQEVRCVVQCPKAVG